MKLILFDIDGTLIRSNGAGRAALQVALEDVYGTAGPIADYPMSGKTDWRIVRDLLTAVRFTPAQIDPKLPTLYHRMGEVAREMFPHKGIKPCDGIMQLLAFLRTQEDVVLGLLTGNNDQTALLKLEAAGIDVSPFKVNAFGSEAIDRNDLPAIAYKRALALMGDTAVSAKTFIIGDTPADVLCARAGQAVAIAVASGWHGSETLAKYRPDYLFKNLGDTTAVLESFGL